jgi:hypothetical protein
MPVTGHGGPSSSETSRLTIRLTVGSEVDKITRQLPFDSGRLYGAEKLL